MEAEILSEKYGVKTWGSRGFNLFRGNSEKEKQKQNK